MALHWAEEYIKVAQGPLGVVRACTVCGFADFRPRGYGRGSGMREGNKQRGRMIQHVKEKHPDLNKGNPKG